MLYGILSLSECAFRNGLYIFVLTTLIGFGKLGNLHIKSQTESVITPYNIIKTNDTAIVVFFEQNKANSIHDVTAKIFNSENENIVVIRTDNYNSYEKYVGHTYRIALKTEDK